MNPPLTKLNFTFLFRQSVLIILFSFLLLLDSTNADLNSVAINLFSLIVFCIFFTYWIFAGSRLDSRWLIPFGILTIVGLIALITSSDPYRSITTLGLWLLPLILFYLSADLSKKGWSAGLFMDAILIVGFLLMAFTWIGVIQWYGEWLHFSGGMIIPTVSYRLAAPNVQAWNLHPLIMLSGMRLLTSNKKWGIAFWIIYLLSALALLFLTSSRGGWLAAASGLGILGWYLIQNKKEWLVSLWNRYTRSKIYLIAGSIFVICFLAIAGRLLYAQAIQPSHGSILDARAEYWPPAWQAFLQHPLFGEGLGTFSNVLMRAHSTPPFSIYLHAHSVLFTTLAEMGLIGLLALIVCIIVIGFLFFGKSNRKLHMNSVLYWSTFATYISFIVHSIFDFFVGKTTGTWIFAILLGLLFSKLSTSDRKFRWVLIPSFTAIVFLGFVWFVSSTMQVAILGIQNSDSETALTTCQKVAFLQVSNTAFQTQMGLMTASSSAQLHLDNLTQAEGYFREVTRLDPDWALGHLNLAAILAAEGDLIGAREEIDQAATLSPDCALIQLNLGWVAEQQRDLDTASTAYMHVLALEPEWRIADFWRENDFREQIHALWQLDNPSIDVTNETDLLNSITQNPNSAASILNLAQFRFEQGNITEALRLTGLSRLVVLQTNLDSVEATWLEAEIQVQEGNLQQALNLAEESLRRYLHQGIAGPNTFQGSLYQTMAFRSIVMQQELAPQVQIIALPDRWVLRIEELSNWYQTLGDGENSNRWLDLCQQLTYDGCR